MDGSSNDSGNRTVRLGTTRSCVAGSCSSMSCEDVQQPAGGKFVGVEMQVQRAHPGSDVDDARDADAGPALPTARGRACAARGRVPGRPYSTRMLSSPPRRYATSGRSSTRRDRGARTPPSLSRRAGGRGRNDPVVEPNPTPAARAHRRRTTGTKRTVSPGRICPSFHRSRLDHGERGRRSRRGSGRRGRAGSGCRRRR